MRGLAALALALVVALPSCALAQDFDLHGYLDVRAVVPANETSWTDGGLGKTRFGGGDAIDARFGGAALQGIWHFAPSWIAVADVQAQSDEHPSVDLLDAYLRFRPVSTTPWRWSAKLGAFFPPISLENDGVGWTSTWTLTPSAIDSWVGEELRTIGAEANVEYRGDASTLEAGAALFEHNDPAGELLAARGWSLSDLTSGLNASVREPDVFASHVGSPAPIDYQPFSEIGQRIGWYADVTWKALRGMGSWTATALRRTRPGIRRTSRNTMDARYSRGIREFWSLARRKDERRRWYRPGSAQAMDGDTEIEPVEDV